jgi:hypothetical protein
MDHQLFISDLAQLTKSKPARLRDRLSITFAEHRHTVAELVLVISFYITFRPDVGLVWKLERFGRSLKHLVNALAEFLALGITFASLKDNLDLSTPRSG